MHEVVGPTALNGLDEERTYERTHCRLCECPSGYFERLEDRPPLSADEFGFPAAVVPVFGGAYAEWWLAAPDKLEAVAHAGLGGWLSKELAKDMRVALRVVNVWIGSGGKSSADGDRLWTLNQWQAERLLGIARLIGQVEVLAAGFDAGAGFKPARWMGTWLQTPHPALDARPDQTLASAAERQVLSDLLARLDSGAFS